jgi:thiol:disulfide interchange protein
MLQRVFGLLCLAVLLCAPVAAIDESDLLPVDEAFVITSAPTADGRVAITWTIADGYYLYRHRFAIDTADPAALSVDAVDWPPGEQYEDEFFGKTETYRGSVTATATLRGSGPRAGLKLRYQGCADLGICYPPQTRVIEVDLPAGTAPPSARPAAPAFLPLGGASGKPALPGLGLDPVLVDAEPLPPEQAFITEAIASHGGELLLRFTPAEGYYLYRDKTRLRLLSGEGVALGTPQWPEATPHVDDHFGEVMVYFGQIEVPLPLRRSRGEPASVELEVEIQGCQTDGICYPPMIRRLVVALPAADPTSLVADLGAASATTPGANPDAPPAWWLAILMALAGGIILNLMPCVLPVLSLKVLGVAGQLDDRAAARRHAHWYSLGVLVSFAAVGLAVLGLREARLALGWGFQLQQPLVVTVLAWVMLAVGLSLSGLYQIGGGLAGVGQSLTERSGASGDFFTGVLAVVVATPCTAPLMGPALAFAFAAPTALALAVFLALGLGLALPFLLIGWVPALARLLPRPGAWMDTFKQLLAFPMYLTAVWLLWVLAKQRGADAIALALIGATLIGLAGWALAHAQVRQRRWGKPLALLALLLALWPLAEIAGMVPAATTSSSTDAAAADGSLPYSVERLAALRKEGRVVFVNMTADWCVTCKANEKTVLSSLAFKESLQAAGAAYLKGDWTNVDPAITAFLDAHGAVGVPLYVVFPRGGGDGRRLPTVLTTGIVEEALRDAAR